MKLDKKLDNIVKTFDKDDLFEMAQQAVLIKPQVISEFNDLHEMRDYEIQKVFGGQLEFVRRFKKFKHPFNPDDEYFCVYPDEDAQSFSYEQLCDIAEKNAELIVKTYIDDMDDITDTSDSYSKRIAMAILN